jgi:hypothetical protein
MTRVLIVEDEDSISEPLAYMLRKEWAWRISRGESTRNLEAFRGWLEAGVGDDEQG